MGREDVVDVIQLDCSQALYMHGILIQKLRTYVWAGRADSHWLKLGCTSGLTQRNQWQLNAQLQSGNTVHWRLAVGLI